MFGLVLDPEADVLLLRELSAELLGLEFTLESSLLQSHLLRVSLSILGVDAVQLLFDSLELHLGRLFLVVGALCLPLGHLQRVSGPPLLSFGLLYQSESLPLLLPELQDLLFQHGGLCSQRLRLPTADSVSMSLVL